MCKIITDPEKIYQARAKLFRNFIQNAKCIKTETGNRGGNSYPVVFWREDLKIWLDLWLEFQPIKYGIAWGIADPNKSNYVKQIVQTNVAAKGCNLGLASTFLEDPDGKIYLTHNGNIKGGAKGIGPNKFWKHYQGDSLNKIVRMDISSLNEIANFVHEVARIKSI